jgi:hypothetical protein
MHTRIELFSRKKLGRREKNRKRDRKKERSSCRFFAITEILEGNGKDTWGKMKQDKWSKERRNMKKAPGGGGSGL